MNKARVRVLLSILYEEMGLHQNSPIVMPGELTKEERRELQRLWHALGTLALGSDAPEMWEYT